MEISDNSHRCIKGGLCANLGQQQPGREHINHDQNMGVVGTQYLTHDALDNFANLGISQSGLGLALKLGIRDLHPLQNQLDITSIKSIQAITWTSVVNNGCVSPQHNT